MPRFREIATPPSDRHDDQHMSEWGEMLIGLACIVLVVLEREQYNGPRAVPG